MSFAGQFDTRLRKWPGLQSNPIELGTTGVTKSLQLFSKTVGTSLTENGGRDCGKAARRVGSRQPRAFDCIQSLDPNKPNANKNPYEETKKIAL